MRKERQGRKERRKVSISQSTVVKPLALESLGKLNDNFLGCAKSDFQKVSRNMCFMRSMYSDEGGEQPGRFGTRKLKLSHLLLALEQGMLL